MVPDPLYVIVLEPGASTRSTSLVVPAVRFQVVVPNLIDTELVVLKDGTTPFLPLFVRVAVLLVDVAVRETEASVLLYSHGSL